jgi:hypothetical protein
MKNIGQFGIRFLLLAVVLWTATRADAQTYSFVWATGSQGAGDGQFNSDLGPRGLVVVDNLLYVCDYSNNRIEWFDINTGAFAGKKNLGSYITDIDYDPNRGRFYVRQFNSVIASDKNLNQLWQTSINTQFWVHYGLCVDSQGNIHTPSAYYPYVYILNPSGQQIGQYTVPAGAIGIEAMDGCIYVACGGNGINKYTETGASLGQVLTGTNTPHYLCKLPGSRIAVSLNDNEVAVFDSAWQEQSRFGGSGTANGLFKQTIGGLASDGSGSIYASDNGSGGGACRIQKFAKGTDPSLEVSVRWDQPNPRIEVQGYLFDRKTGAVVSTGTGSYAIKNSVGTPILQGTLTYQPTSRLWTSGLVNFPWTGDFTAEVTINTSFNSQRFSVGVRTATIAGTVKILNGGYAAGALVKAYDHVPVSDSDPPTTSAVCDSLGRYWFRNVRAGNWWLRASNASGLKGGTPGFYAFGSVTQNLVLYNYRVPIEAVSALKDSLVRFFNDQNTKLIRISELVDDDVGPSAAKSVLVGAELAVEVIGVVKTIYTLGKAAVQIGRATGEFLASQKFLLTVQLRTIAYEGYAATPDPGLRNVWNSLPDLDSQRQNLLVAHDDAVQKTIELAETLFKNRKVPSETIDLYRDLRELYQNISNAFEGSWGMTLSKDSFLRILDVSPVAAEATQDILLRGQSDLTFGWGRHKLTTGYLTTAVSPAGRLYTSSVLALSAGINEFARNAMQITPSASVDWNRVDDFVRFFSGQVDLSRDQTMPGVYSPWGENMPLCFNDAYAAYLRKHDELTGVLVGKTALVVAKVSMFFVSFGTGPVGIVASVATSVAMSYVEDQLAAAETQITAQAAETFAMSAGKWAQNLVTALFLQERVHTLLAYEIRVPYFLDKNRQFSATVSNVDIHPDYVAPLSGRKVNFCWDWGSLLPGGFPAFNVTRDKPVSLRVTNTGSSAPLRVVVLSRQASLAQAVGSAVASGLQNWDYYQTSHVDLWPSTLVRYVNRNQSVDVTLKYSGRYEWLLSLLKPNRVEIQPLAGPYPQLPIVEEYWVFNNILSLPLLFSTKEELVAAAEKNPERILFPARTEKGLLSFRDLMELTTAQTSNDRFYLSLATPEYSKTVVASASADKLIVELYPAVGADVDLHVYEGTRHVGFVPSAGQVEIAFPCVYSGPNSCPETVTVPNAAGRTFVVKARLNRINSNLQIPCTLIVSEEPKRASAILAVESLSIQRARPPGTTETLRIGVAEISGQKPVQNISVRVGPLTNKAGKQLQRVINKDYPSSYTLSLLPAGEMREYPFAFRIPRDASGTYSGKAYVSSQTAGSLEIQISIAIITAARRWEHYK